ncbi:unnamed protein product, partial [Enterobius vermicularis]|uniref:CCM2_C domain-containing protein n=1 Tax=Enterobius vermicularis TaxID=51028 RepID=A0A0N4VD27_ENTVE
VYCTAGERERELLLRVPVHSIASVGLIREGYENILPIKIGDTATNGDLFDLAVIYCSKLEVAEEICNFLGQCFSQVYKEAAGSFDLKASSITSNLTDSHQDLRTAGTRTLYSTTASRSESLDERTDELIKEYMSMLTACLSTEELAQYARLIVRWREGSMPMNELAQKLTELYGPKRLHLLTVTYTPSSKFTLVTLESTTEIYRRFHDGLNGGVVNSENEQKINSVAVCIGCLPPHMLVKIEMLRCRLLVECIICNKVNVFIKMNNTSGRPNTAGTGIRSFFSKLRKPSDQHPQVQITSVYIGFREAALTKK